MAYRCKTDGSELHRDTLMGEWDPLIVALLEEWCIINGIDTDNDTLVKYFRAHLNRGVRLLYGRVKGLQDLAGIFYLEISKKCHGVEIRL